MINQLTKIIVNIFFKDISFRVLNGMLGFDIYLNRDYMSMFNSDFGLDLSTLTLILINIRIFLFLISLYLYVLESEESNKKNKDMYCYINRSSFMFNNRKNFLERQFGLHSIF